MLLQYIAAHFSVMFAVPFDDKSDLRLHKSCSKQQIAFRGADMVCKYTPCQQFFPSLSTTVSLSYMLCQSLYVSLAM